MKVYIVLSLDMEHAQIAIEGVFDSEHKAEKCISRNNDMAQLYEYTYLVMGVK